MDQSLEALEAQLGEVEAELESVEAQLGLDPVGVELLQLLVRRGCLQSTLQTLQDLHQELFEYLQFVGCATSHLLRQSGMGGGGEFDPTDGGRL